MVESAVWNEMSFRHFNRKNERELDEFELEELREQFDVVYYGLYEDLSLCNCRGIEDWWEIIEEFN